MKSNLNCYVLLAKGYGEESVHQAKQFLHGRGVSLTFLRLYLDRVIDDNPINACSLEPVVSLLMDDVIHAALPNGLLLAGGKACGHQFLVDPRVHHFVHQMQLAARPVGFLYPVCVPLVEMLNRQVVSQPFLFQERQHLSNFLRDFADAMHPPRKIKQKQFFTSLL